MMINGDTNVKVIHDEIWNRVTMMINDVRIDEMENACNFIECWKTFGCSSEIYLVVQENHIVYQYGDNMKGLILIWVTGS